ncbi:hypothetical protein [Rhodococcus triatomae]|nr:hypothetical protein G419_13896 [Rhodococcus triatomae BKS 15-14]
MNIRRIVTRAAAVAAVAVSAIVGGVGVGTASAAPIPGLFYYGQTIAVLGQNSGCNGLVDYRLDSDPAKPGVVIITFTSRGMNGVGPAWEADPVCPIDFDVIWDAAAFGFGSVAGHQVKTVEFKPTRSPGDSISAEIVTGPGLHLVGIGASYVNQFYTELRPQFGTPSSGYIIVP